MSHYCPSFPCPLCHPCCCPPPGYQGLWPGYSAPVQQGCICPPGAEKTCQGPACPRQPIRAMAGYKVSRDEDSSAGQP